MLRRAAPGLAVMVAAALLGAVATPALASATLPPVSDTWIRVKTAHFVLFSNAPERRTLELGRRLERFRAALTRFNKKFVVDAPVVTSLFIFKDDAALTPYKKRFNGRPVELTGLFVGRSDANYILVNGARQGDPLEVVYHEYTHHFLGNNLHNIPPWFNEGLAECYSKFQSDEKTASIGLTQSDHVLYLREHPLISLHDLFAITQDSPDYNEGERRGVFYAESWALMHYFLWDKPERKPQFVKFLERLGRGEHPDNAFPSSFETSYQTIENELRLHVRGARFVYTRFSMADLGVDEKVTVAPMKRVETLCRLGDLLAHIDPDRAAEAAEYFGEARRLDSEYAPAWAGLGYVASLSGRHDEAISLFDKAIAIDPDDPMTRFHLGECLVERASGATSAAGGGNADGDLKRAGEMFLKTIELRQGFAEAYVELARVMMGQGGEPGPAIHLLEAVRGVLPSRIDVVRNLAWLYARKGDTARAHDLVENVIGLMNDREALEQGRRVVQQEEGRSTAFRSTGSQPVTADTQTDEGLDTVEGQPPGPTDDYDSRFNRHLLAYNQAVALANKRDYKGAIAILEDLLKQEKDDDLRGETSKLLDRLRADAARLRKSGG